MHRQRYQCKQCGAHFDDLTDPSFAGHHQLLRMWILCLYLMGLNLLNHQTAQELEFDSKGYPARSKLRDPRNLYWAAIAALQQSEDMDVELIDDGEPGGEALLEFPTGTFVVTEHGATFVANSDADPSA